MSTEVNASSEGSMPLRRSEQTWGPLAVFGNTASAAIATWCFITGGWVAYYVGAGRGGIAITAGTLIGVFIALLAALPAATRYGVEAVRSTRPQLGVRGTWLTLALVLVILVGWNSVLTIFLSQAGHEALGAMGAPGEVSQGRGTTAIGVIICLAVFALLWRGPDVLRLAGPTIAIAVLILSVIIMAVLLVEFGWGHIFDAVALGPLPDDRTNYMIVIELGIAGAVAWWPYVGSLTRHARSTRGAFGPAVLGLGVMMSLVLVIGLFAALVVPESGGNPTMFMIEVGGPALGLVALAFMVLANVGTTMVGVYACALALKQVPAIDRRISWRGATALSLLPVIGVVTFFADPFMAHYGTFLAFAGVTLGPVCGMQIVDYYILRRQELDVRGLYDESSTVYGYWRGFNPAGFLAIGAGVAAYVVVLDPVHFVPGPGFTYISATVPATLASGLTYYAAMKLVPGLLRGSLTGGRPEAEFRGRRAASGVPTPAVPVAPGMSSEAASQ